MRQIGSLGLVVVLLGALSRTASADQSVSTETAGLVLTLTGAATALVSSVLLIATYTCHPNANGEGCPGGTDKQAGAIGLGAGIAMLGIGVPMYFASPRSAGGPGRQAASALTGMSLALRF
jgi:hypothetical protein